MTNIWTNISVPSIKDRVEEITEVVIKFESEMYVVDGGRFITVNLSVSKGFEGYKETKENIVGNKGT